MADRKNNNVPNTGANLLFGGAPEFNFNLPFMPVSQASGPVVLSGEDSSEVGEEDSFLGQTSENVQAPTTFSYFSNPVTSSDPFASIGQLPCPPPSSSAAAITVYQSSMGRHTPPPSTMTPPPPQMQPQNHNPYRHTATSSRASPYIPAPEVLPPSHAAHTSQHNPYSVPSGSQSFPLSGPTFTKPPPTHMQSPPPPPANPAGAVVPTGPMMQYNYNVYEPIQPHWFYCKLVESKSVWLPFSIIDSLLLEETYNSVQPDPENVIVRTDGGRFDVHLYDRMRSAVYWEEEDSEVRRCSWFYKGDADSRFVPYSEEFSDKLEAEYKKAVSTNQWHRRLEFPSGETIVMHNPKVIVQFQPSPMPDEWGPNQDPQTRPRVVKRGIDDDHDQVPDGELPKVDHLVFMVHGIGPVCDLRFRSMVECVDDFRSVSLKLLQSHFKKPLDDHAISRVEFLPVHWHTALHGDATGVDRRIKKITLPSTGRLRHFTNETLLDVLFYNSPTYCQTIMDTVASEINRLYALFMKRNPDYKGTMSVAGHSLGSLILFDLLSNQKTDTTPTALPTTNEEAKQVAAPDSQAVIPPAVEEEPKEEELEDLSAALEHLGLSEYKSTFDEEKIDIESLLMCTMEDLKEMGIPLGPRKKIAKYVKERVAKQTAAQEKKAEVQAVSEVVEPAQAVGTAPEKNLPAGVSSIHVDYNYFEVGTGQVSVVYHNLDFNPLNFFALGSPIGMFLTVRGLEKIEETYQLPTCKGFFNIYHPLDPVAYRIEPMIIPDLELKPVLIPHHKGRKRLHLELKESLSRMGSDLKHGFISSLKSAWQTLNDFARAHTSSAQLQAELAMVANQIEEQEKRAQDLSEQKSSEIPEPPKEEEPQVHIGMLNGGNRIDFVLQEKPIESFNEYLFALQSHVCYWQSEDTVLLILKEIYKSMGVQPENMAH
ncbi:SEC23-interacting protein isoform X2 [Corythoichthys intestinalis]|uniref:SEC23-interacting protein isoform X2 n=1 Tax=Corythoichthys intestinalis TaxID=161448 RepID=UPI0025A6812B|nr:SEC23-interacting protein isoform X2 [Corythoichthys intestinalis]